METGRFEEFTTFYINDRYRSYLKRVLATSLEEKKVLFEELLNAEGGKVLDYPAKAEAGQPVTPSPRTTKSRPACSSTLSLGNPVVM